MADVTLSDRAPRLALSWGAFLTIVGLVATAVRTQSEVGIHAQQIAELKSAAAQAATKADIERLESRMMRIESLLLSQQTRTGR